MAKVSATLNVLHLAPGIYEVNVGLVLSTDVTVTGRSAVLDRSGGTPGPVVTTTADIILEFITVTGGHSTNGLGVNTTAGTLTMKRATIYGNTGGGVAVNAGVLATIVNNVIVRNGNPSNALFGGVNLSAVAATSVFEFNTVADNDAGTAGFGGGVVCGGVLVNLRNSIVANNKINGMTAPSNAQILNCPPQTSAVLPSSTTLKFKNDTIEPYDYHLLFGSVAIDAATTTSMMNGDFDGDVRPQGAAKDQGADEYK